MAQCLKLSSVYFQYVNERATNLKLDRDSPLISPVDG